MHIELSSIHCDEDQGHCCAFVAIHVESYSFDGPAHFVMSLADLRPLWLTGIVP